MKYIVLGLIRLYQLTISPMLGECCRFHPHCSEYAMEVMRKQGSRGIWLIIKRIVKCNPWHPGGHDPVP